MPRKSVVHYILPSAISIIPNANGSPNDLAVTITRGAKIKVNSPVISALMPNDGEYLEWAFAGRNRRLGDTNAPYTIYARLSKQDRDNGYLVFSKKVEEVEGSGIWRDAHPYVTEDGSVPGADDDPDYWYFRMGDVSLPENGLRTVTLDTGILGTPQYNEDWKRNPDGAPLRVEIGCVMNDEDAGPTPYIHWNDSLQLSAVLKEGWGEAVTDRLDHWEIQRINADGTVDQEWPGESRAAAFASFGVIVLSHVPDTDDFGNAVSRTFVVSAWGTPEPSGITEDSSDDSSSSDSSSEGDVPAVPVLLATGSINILAETMERYELALSADSIIFNPADSSYTPGSGIAVRIRKTGQRGEVSYLTYGQLSESGLTVSYAAVDSATWTPLSYSGSDDDVASATIETSAFSAGKSINIRLVYTPVGGSGMEVNRKTVAYVRYGDSITVTDRSVTYQTSSSGSAVPSGSWSQNIPSDYGTKNHEFLWTKTEVTFSDGKKVTSYSVSHYGADGTLPVIADIDDEMDAVPCNASGNTKVAYDKYVYVNLWKGDVSQTLTQLSASASPASGVTINTDKSNKRVRIRILQGTTVAEKTVVTISLAASGISTRTLYFTLNGVRAGADGGDAVIWSLVPSASGIVKRKDGSTEPASDITCAVTKNVGGTQSTPAASEYTLNRYIDGVKQPSYAATPPASVGSSLKFELVVGGKVVDVETIPVVADGTDGTDGTAASQVRPNMLLRTVFEQGLNRIKEKWSANWNAVTIDTDPDTQYIQGRQSLRINSSTIQDNIGFIQNVLGKLKPNTTYTFSFYCFASRSFIFYINNVINGVRTNIYENNKVIRDGQEFTVQGNGHNDVNFGEGRSQTYHTITFKTNSNVSTEKLELGFYMSYTSSMSSEQVLVLCMPKLEEGNSATAYIPNEDDLQGTDGDDAVVYKLTPVVEQALVSRDKELTVNLQYKLLRYEGDASTDYGFSGFFIECTVGSTPTGIGEPFVISDNNKLASLSKSIDGLYSGSPLFYTVSLYYGDDNRGVLVDRRTVPVTMAANVVFEVGEDSIRSAVTQVTNIKNYFGFNRGILNYPASGSEACQLYPYGYGLACWSGRNMVYNLGLGTEDNNSTWTLYFEARANSNLNVNVNFCYVNPDTINGESVEGGQITLNTSWKVFRCVWSSPVSDVTGYGRNGYIDFEQSGTSLFYIRKICLVKGVKPMLEFVKADEDLTYSGGLQNFQWNIVATLDSQKFMGMNVYKNPCKLNNPTVTYQWSGSWTKSGNTYTSNTISHGGKTIERINVTTARADIKIRITAYSESGYDFVAVGKANTSLANETASTIKQGSSNIVGYASGNGVTKEVTLSFWGNGFFELIYAKDASGSSYGDYGTVEIVEVSIPYMDFFKKTIDIKNKTPYTLSFWAKASVDNVVIVSHLYESSWNLWKAFGQLENMTSADGSCYTILSKEWKHYTVHWYPNVEAITGTDASKKLVKNIIGCRLQKMDSPYGNNNADIYLAGVTYQEGWVEDGQSTMAFQTSEIKQTADEISSTVQTLVPTVNGLSESVSQISQTSDRIAATVDNMRIGGRNLVLNGAFNYGNKYWSDWGSPEVREIVTDDRGKKWMHILTTATQYQGYSQIHFDDYGITIDGGRKYTVSIRARGRYAGQKVAVGFHWRNHAVNTNLSQSWVEFTVDTKSEGTLYSATIDVPESGTYNGTTYAIDSFNIMVGHRLSSVQEFYVTDIQFEEGTMPTDWRESIEENHSLIEQTASEIKLEVEGELGECGIGITKNKITLNGNTEVKGMLTLNDDTQGFKVTGNGGNTYITPKTIEDESAWSNRAAIDITCTRKVSKVIVEDTQYYQGVFTSTSSFGYAKSGSQLILKNHSLTFQQKGYSPITPVTSGTTKTYTKYYIYIGSSTTPTEVTVNGTSASSITTFTISSGGNVKVVQEVHGVFSKEKIHTSSSQSSLATIPEMVCAQSYVATMPTGTVESVIGYDGLGINFGTGKYVYIGQESAVFKFGDNGLKVTSSGVQRLAGGAGGTWLDINKMYVKRTGSSYTVTDTDGVGMVVGTSNTTALTVTLPSPGNNTGRKIYIKPLGSAGMKVAASTACIVNWDNRSNAVNQISDLSEGLQVFMSDGQYWNRRYFGD